MRFELHVLFILFVSIVLGGAIVFAGSRDKLRDGEEAAASGNDAAARVAKGPRANTGGLSLIALAHILRQSAASAANDLRVNGAQKVEAANDSAFRISHASSAGADRDALFPDVAYNPDDNEYLVVWAGNGLAGADFRGVKEVFGQRINAATGASVGAEFRISNMADGGKNRNAGNAQLVYNSTAHEYLIVWNGSGDKSAPDSVFEIYGQRFSRTGSQVGPEFRISNTTELGKVADTFVRASTRPDIAWNSTDNQYLVVWDGMGQPEDTIKTEVYGQLLNAAGGALGKNFRISNTTDQGAEFNASAAVAAYNSINKQYLVVWSGSSREKSQYEIWGQGLTAQGAQIGEGKGDFLVSSVTGAGADRDASAPQIVYSNGSNEYLVVFHATGMQGANNTSDVLGQRINAATLAKVGPSDFRISNGVGPKNMSDNPRVAYNAPGKEYLVVWRGFRADAPFEIYGQRLGPNGNEIETDFQISNIAAVGKDRNANLASVACNSQNGEYLAVWQGDALPGPANKKVNEIFGLRIKPSSRSRP
jgi:hypothetical protein